MKRYVPVEKDNLRMFGHTMKDVVVRLNTELLKDGVTRPDVSQADMLAGPHIGAVTLQLGGAGLAAPLRMLEALENFDLTPILSSSAMQEIWQHLRWARGGRVVYDLVEPLGHALLQTDVSVTGEDIVFPVPSFYIAVPPELQLTVWHQESGEHLLDGFYVNEIVHSACPPEAQTDERGTLCTIASGAKYTVPFGRERSLAVFVQAQPRPGFSLDDAAHVHFSIPLKPVPRPGGGPAITDLEEWLTRHDQVEQQQRMGDTLVNIGENQTRLWLWSRLILNTCLYLTSDDVDIESRRLMSEHARKHSKTLGSNAKKRYVDQHTNKDVRYSVLGSKLRLDPDVSRQIAADPRTVQARFIVRGHWRNQAHGEGRVLRKRLWIQPHWKGPAWSEIVARVQTVTP